MILFLDFDGVLHPFHRPQGALELLPDFERVMRDYPQVDIVISSSWREGYSLEELRAFFSEDIAARVVDVTPVLPITGHLFVREAEIAAWRKATGRAAEPWVAIDDCALFFSPDCAHLVLVDPRVGFNAVAERVLRERLLLVQVAEK
ncbi:MAG TPA: HAD domain-containing protein [Noviherbaspirillum sp.]|nr:HAD domain-containing protein [Noviherbaspirillum sp.]